MIEILIKLATTSALMFIVAMGVDALFKGSHKHNPENRGVKYESNKYLASFGVLSFFVMCICSLLALLIGIWS